MYVFLAAFCGFALADGSRFHGYNSTDPVTEHASEPAKFLPKDHLKETKLHTEAEPVSAPSGIRQALDSNIIGDALEPETMSHSHNDAYKVIFMIMGSLLLGAILLIALERHLPSFPYTVAMFILGCLVGCWHASRSPTSTFSWHSWFRSVEMWEAIDPHLLFYVFLPPLLFAEAMKLNVHLVIQCFWQAFLLACPGVLLGTGLVAAVAKFMLPYGWDWTVCLIFGSMLAATDPVAVVALFNTLGVSPRLTMLVSGESLLNDGTAIVIFQLMLKAFLGASLDYLSVLKYFAHMTLTSVFVGAGVGFAAVAVIQKCSSENFKSDAMIQVVTTLCCAYLSFLVTESEFGASGVLGTVSAGFVVSCYAWPLFASQEIIHIVWETIEFVGNTVIFFLAGLLFACSVLDKWHFITWPDVGRLLLLYIMLLIIRSVMLGVLWIPLNMVGAAIDWREAVVMVWSGLRGAVSLTLAIIIDEEPRVDDKMGSRIMFHVGGIAALSLVVNATTAGTLLQYLGLVKTSEAGERKLACFSQHVAQHVVHTLEKEIKKDDQVLAGTNSEMLKKMVPALTRSKSCPPQRPADGSEDETAETYREAFLQTVKSQYWSLIDRGVVPKDSKSARILVNSANQALGNPSQALNDWDSIARGLRDQFVFLGTLGISIRSAGRDLDQTMQKVYCTTAFLVAHKHARDELPHLLPLCQHIQDKIFKESQDLCDEAIQELQSISPDAVEVGKTQMLARRLLHKELEELMELKEHGLLADAEASRLGQDVQDALLKLLRVSTTGWLAMKNNGATSTSMQAASSEKLSPSQSKEAMPSF